MPIPNDSDEDDDSEEIEILRDPIARKAKNNVRRENVESAREDRKTRGIRFDPFRYMEDESEISQYLGKRS